MTAPTVKQRVLEALEQLPADAGFEDVMERIYFLSKIERGLEQLDRGEVVSHDEVKRRFLK
jgi:predicted transcriptional regulator